MVYPREKHKVRLISNERYFRKPVSRTFHGRDIFAPVAAHLAAGVTPARIGKLIAGLPAPEFEKPQRAGKRTWIGRILKIDRFGNIVTNFHVNGFSGSGDGAISRWRWGRRKLTVLARNYAETRPGGAVCDRGELGVLRGFDEPGLGRETGRVRGGRAGGTDAAVVNDSSRH